jgi:SAM-dependent methyltransferase
VKSSAAPDRRAAAVSDVALYDGLFERWMGKLAADLPMILEVAKQARGPVLEFGIGPGRVAVALARSGHRVTGVDDSKAMLQALEARLAEERPAVRARVTWFRQDLRRLRLPRSRFRLVLIPFNTLCHFESLADQDKVIAGAARALGRGGWLWLSVFRLDPTRPTGVVRAEPTPLSGGDPRLPGSRTEVFFQQRFEPAAQVTEARFWIDTVAPDGLVRRQSMQLRLRWFERFELERLLSGHGFEVRHVWGDFDGSEFTDTSPQIVILARKR